MDKVVICHSCGRTMESAFNFCPWCGDRIDRGDQVGRGDQANPTTSRGRGGRTEFSALTELIESVFSQVESMQTTHACSRISRMENELGELEKELSLLIAGEHTS